MRSFKAVYDTASREGGLRRQARQNGEQLTAELKKRVQEIDQAFLRAKDVPVAKFNRVRTRIQELQLHWDAIAQAAQEALAKHSLTPPTVDLSPATLERMELTTATADADLDRLATTGRRCTNKLRKVGKLPSSQVFRVALVGGRDGERLDHGGDGDRSIGPGPWLIAGIVGATLAVGLLLLSLLGIRPVDQTLCGRSVPQSPAAFAFGKARSGSGFPTSSHRERCRAQTACWQTRGAVRSGEAVA